ncbi:MAG: hypothetical protein J6S34_04595 [Clostridia bacterium]|nr:hypothetical protein [Clostridia bacterium]
MKKSFGLYSIVWAICLAVFNVTVFVIPREFTTSFWIGYIGITVAFLAQLACAFAAFTAKNLEKLFYNLSLISVSYSGLVAMLIAGSVLMAISSLPEWVGIVVCVIIFAANAIAIIKASATSSVVSGIDKKVQEKTFFIKTLTVDAQNLMASAKQDEIRQEAKKVYEAIRYSDPVTNASLSDLDHQIEREFNAFAEAVREEDSELAKETADAILQTIQKRNQKCKLLK